MAFWRTTPTAPVASLPPPFMTADQAAEHFFRTWTEDLYISGFVSGATRLSDVLNAREPLKIEQPKIHALRSAGWPTRPGGHVVVDPFDLEFVLGHAISDAGPDRSTKRIHKVQYPVLIEGQSFEIVGTMHVFPGNAPEVAAHRSGQLFLPITQPSVRREQRLVSDRDTDVVLVNRYAIRSIRQLDTPARN